MKRFFLALCLLLSGLLLPGLLPAAPAELQAHDDLQFKKIFAPGAAIQKLAGDMKFLEGPVWIPAGGGYLVFSDIPANQLKKWTARDGVTTFREPSQNANGNATDLQGRLLTAEHSGRRVSLTEKDGTVRTVVDSFDGKRLNSPNDVVVKSDGTIWLTDPDYGLGGKPKEQPGNYVYRFDPAAGAMTAVARDFDKPNGLCFSPDESKLYVADSGKPRHIRVFAVTQGGELKDGKVFCAIDKGGPDGIRCDADGRIWTSSGHGAQVFAPNGSVIATIQLPESAANLCFGGADGRTLFLTARTSLYAVETLTQAAGRTK